VRKSLLILLSAELLVAAALGRLGHLDQPAALEWNQHPTVETRRAFEREKQIEKLGRLGFSGGVFTVLASATIFVYWLRRGDPLMLILKRFGTALVLFIILFPVLFVGSLVMGVGIVGSHAEASHYQSGYKEGEVGAGFGRDYGAIIFGGALGISVLASVTVAFSGVLPWCRRPPQPPKLPACMAAESGRARCQS
jgi:hypothetical protein